MCKCLLKTIIKHIQFLLALIFVANTVFAANVIISGGRGSIIGDGPFGNEIVLAGDSYAQHFLKDEKDKGIKFYEYSAEGTTIEENKKQLTEAFNSYHRMIFLSISVNDQMRGTHPMIFEKNYRDLLDKSVETEKIVFIHTYIHYPVSSIINFEFPTYVYDAVARKLASEYQNVYYIDMSDCEDVAFSTGDGLHYSKAFNDIMFDRLKQKIEEVQKNNYD